MTTRFRRLIALRGVLLAALVAVPLVAFAGCGSGGSGSGTQTHAAGHDMSSSRGDASATTGMTPLVSGADGTRASAAGYTLRPESSRLPTGSAATWAFTIRDAHGMTVTRFERDQTKLLHLIVVRSDLTGYQHLHPMLHAGGRFTIALTLRRPGRYRAITDFTTSGKRYALGTTLVAPGAAVSATLPGELSTATASGYRVGLAHPAVRAGNATTMSFTITRGGQPVTKLQPYLGAYGHLVALRSPDAAYSHVHPVGQRLAAGRITFDAELPTAGTYRLFLQFRAAGRIHTAGFTLRAKR